jgi:hypothetical protein
MKIKKHLYIQILLFLLISNSVLGQLVRPAKPGEFVVDDNISTGLTAPPCNTPIECGESDLIFNTSPSISSFSNAVISNGLAIERAKDDELEAWYDRQEDLMEEYLENHLNDSFSNFDEAREALFNESEIRPIEFGTTYNKDKYNRLKNTSRTHEKNNLRDLKLLLIRKAEINAGNLNNSQFAFSEVDGVALKDIRNLDLISQKWGNMYGHFKINNPKRFDYQSTYNKLLDLGIGFNESMLNLKNDEYFNSGYYNNRWKKLNLMQFLINYDLYERCCSIGPYSTPFGPDYYYDFRKATPERIETYALSNKSGIKSVFDPYYDYQNIYNIWLAREGVQEALYQANKWKVARETALNNLLNNISEEDVLAEVAITGLGNDNVAFLDARPTLKAKIKEYFKTNDISDYSKDAINYLLTEYREGNDFAANSDLYISASTPLYQNASNPNRALEFTFGAQAITEGITDFGNVLAELLKDNVNPAFEGYIIRNMFLENGINISNNIENRWLGFGFHFVPTDGNSIEISFEGSFGSILWSQGSSISNYLNNLEEYYIAYYCSCNCQGSEDDFNWDIENIMEPKWGQLANKSQILAEIRAIPNLNSLTFDEQVLALENHFNKNISYTRSTSGVLSISNPSDDIDKYIYTEIAGWLDFHHIFKLFRWANSTGPIAALLTGEMGEIYQNLNGNYSAFSYEDLPSNNVGVALLVRFGNELKQGVMTWEDAIGQALDEMNWVEPESAPNFEYIPHVINNRYPKNFGYAPLLGTLLQQYHKNEFCKRSLNEQNNIREAHEKFPR